jgi:hypothetical protein
MVACRKNHGASVNRTGFVDFVSGFKYYCVWLIQDGEQTKAHILTKSF